jgi:very-short-patch-repair endonuclease
MASRPAVPAVAYTQRGVFTREQAHAAGWSNRMLASAVHRGVLVRRHPDVFVLAGPRSRAADDLAALLAAGAGAVLTAWSAARHHGWSWPGRHDDPACVTVASNRHLQLSGAVVLRWHLPPEHVDRSDDVAAVTIPARTVADCLRLVTAPVAERMLDAALLRRWLSVGDLRTVVEDLSGRPGVPVLRQLLAGVESGARSHAERLAQTVLAQTGVLGWQWNYRVALPGGVTAVLDGALPQLKIAVEIDGLAHHHDVDAFQRDRTRQNALVAAGWTVLRFTWWDLKNRPDYVVAVVRAAVARAS